MAAKILDRYANMHFADYKYREFPKWITPQNGKPVIVQNATEEKELMNVSAEDAKRITDSYEEKARQNDDAVGRSNDKDSLLDKASDLGLVLDRRMSIENIKTAIGKAQAALEDFDGNNA